VAGGGRGKIDAGRKGGEWKMKKGKSEKGKKEKSGIPTGCP
jgi:hypothetical protein